MERKTSSLKKMGLLTLLVSLFFFSNCKKEINRDGHVSDSTTTFIDSTSKSKNFSYNGNLVKSSISAEGGYAFGYNDNADSQGDTNEEPKRSTLRIFENGVELGPAHSTFDDVKNYGKGSFVHWGKNLYFSASDNSDPRTNGRTYSVEITETAVSSPPVQNASKSSTNTTDGLMGYAMVNGTTTGGQGGVETVVTTYKELNAALSDNVKRIIYVRGTIYGSGYDPIYVRSNKSLIGESGAVLNGIILFIFQVNNLIFQNIKFEDYVTYAALQIKEGAHHIWVDHCEFVNDRAHGWEYWGKDITITREADYVTISWSKFHDTNLSVLISGGVEGHESDAGKLHVTMHHNFWYNVTEREPSMNYGRVHMFNNYHLNNSGYSIGIRAGGIVRTDNDYFKNCNKPISTQVAEDPEGYISGLNTNIYENSGKNKITTSESNWVPEYSYKAYLDPAADVPSIVSSGAGPR